MITTSSKKIIKVVLFFLLFSFSSITQLEATEDKVVNLETLAVSLIIDKSGSMDNTDPLNMRETAANIFIDLLSPEDNLGIISFSTEAVMVQPMTNIGVTGKDVIKNNIDGKFNASGNTDYQKAFQKANEQLNNFNGENVKKVIVFLTDGDPDPDPRRLNEPGFMDNYMNGFWDTIKSIGLEGYPVYTVGFGTLDMGVLDRIALETQGLSKVFKVPEEVAVEFFNIISQLKNRNISINEDHVLEGEKIIEFEMDEYVTQMTFVITNTPGDFKLELIPPDGVAIGNNARVESSSNYSLITMTQKNMEFSGIWKIKMTGTSQVSIFGARDLFVKLWISNPIANSQHSINDPINIRATMTGSNLDDFQVEGLMMINGVQSLTPVLMKKDGDIYTGVFNDTKVDGKYEIILNVIYKEDIISKTSAMVSVKILPTITSDISRMDMGFRLNEKRFVSSTLELGSSSLKESSELVLEYYNLIANYGGENEVVFPLNDDGIIENGDVKANDGRFSTNITFDQVGPVNLTIKVRGTYKGDIFILEKNVGDTVIYVPGTVMISAVSDSIEAIKGENISFRINVKSTSDFREILELSVPEELGTLNFSIIGLSPQEENIVIFNFIPASDLNTDEFSILLSVRAENDMTTLNTDNLKINVRFMTRTERLLSIVSRNAPFVLMLLALFFVVGLLIVSIGLVLHKMKVEPFIYVKGELSYFKVWGNTKEYVREVEESVDFSNYKKPRIVLSFDPKKESTADIYVPGSSFTYDIIFEKKIDTRRFKFIDGYRSLWHKSAETVFLRTTEPGILIIGKNIYTNLELNEDTIFNSAEYLFKYTKNKNDDDTKNSAKDILKERSRE